MAREWRELQCEHTRKRANTKKKEESRAEQRRILPCGADYRSVQV